MYYIFEIKNNLPTAVYTAENILEFVSSFDYIDVVNGAMWAWDDEGNKYTFSVSSDDTKTQSKEHKFGSLWQPELNLIENNDIDFRKFAEVLLKQYFKTGILFRSKINVEKLDKLNEEQIKGILILIT